jgi:hypothetical protein
MTDLAIIIVSWNTRDLLRQCLASIKEETTTTAYEITVVDNNSTDGSPDMVAAEFPEITLIRNPENQGFAAANNQALHHLNARYALLLNPDTKIIDRALDRLVAAADQHEPGIMTCKLLNPDFSLQKSVNSFFSLTGSLVENRFFSALHLGKKKQSPTLLSQWDHASDRTIDWAHGAVLLIAKEVIEKIGLLDEQFFIYAEEIDYYFRARQAGFTARFISTVHLIHYGQASSRQNSVAMFIQNYKSFYLFLKKHYPAHVYYLYRFRVLCFLPIWILVYLLRFTLHILYSRERARESFRHVVLYSRTLWWHLFGMN